MFTTMWNKVLKLGAFYDNKKLEDLSQKFQPNVAPALKELDLEERDTTNLTTVALYDVMIFCGMSPPEWLCERVIDTYIDI
jgi:hypothetical protein